MSVFQYMAALEGFAAAHDPDRDRRLTDSEKDDLWSFINKP